MGQFHNMLRAALAECHHYGDFTLSCGGSSIEYYDLAPLLLSPNGLRMVSYEVTSALGSEEFDALGCLELCPVPLVGAVLHATSVNKRGFIVRKVGKGHGTNNLIEGDLYSGDRVVVVEDVTSTGQSVMKAIRAVEERGCRVVRVLTIINRQEGCDELLRDYNFGCLFKKEEL